MENLNKITIKKKILFVTGDPVIPFNGGVQQLTQNLSKSLIDKGYEIICLALYRKGHSEDIIYTVPQYFFPKTDIRSKENISFYNDFILQKKIDVIINQEGYIKLSYLFLNINAEIRKSIKIITVCNNKPLSSYNRNYRYKLFLTTETNVKTIVKTIIKILFFPVWRLLQPCRESAFFRNLYIFILNQSDKFVVNSSKYISEIQSVIHCDSLEDKFVVIPNPNTYSVSYEMCPAKQKQVLYVGRLEPNQKRPDLLLKIWKKIHKKHSDWELIILGSGIMENKLKSYIKRHQLERVYFKGTIDPLPYYRNASIIALTSIYEGFPMILIEAMVHGVVPVLFDSFGAASDVVIPDKTGLLVTPFDINEFASKLSGLIQNEELRHKLSENAKDHVKRYDMQIIMKEWEQLIQNNELGFNFCLK